MVTYWKQIALCLCIGLFTGAVYAQPSQEEVSARGCIHLLSNAQRLTCYDEAFNRQDPTAEKKQSSESNATTHAPTKQRTHLFNHDASSPKGKTTASLLDSRWELSSSSKLGTFNLRGYKPVYLFPVFHASNVNNHPHSSTPGRSARFSPELDHTEAKFQISFKTKLWQNIFGHNGDLWFGYTQSSRWQVYNSRLSRPFRETNYEPEFLLVFNTDYDILGWKGRMLAVGLNHQSNGRSNPLSRSWNRVVANIGFERPNWTVMLRPWIRIPESRSEDDNPDIQDYIGRAKAIIVHEAGHQEYSLLLRHSLRLGHKSHGYARLTWSFPVHRKLRAYMTLSRGYGESLIDYNHLSTYAGIGISLLGWY